MKTHKNPTYCSPKWTRKAPFHRRPTRFSCRSPATNGGSPRSEDDPKGTGRPGAAEFPIDPAGSLRLEDETTETWWKVEGRWKVGRDGRDPNKRERWGARNHWVEPKTSQFRIRGSVCSGEIRHQNSSGKDQVDPFEIQAANVLTNLQQRRRRV